MSAQIVETAYGWTFEVDGYPCGVEWPDRQDCKRAVIAFQNVLDGLFHPTEVLYGNLNAVSG